MACSSGQIQASGITKNGGSYRTIISNILYDLQDHVDTEVMENIQLELMVDLRDPNLQQDIMAVTKLKEVYLIILKDNGNDFRKLILTLTKIILKRTKDLPKELKSRMLNFKQRITQEQADLQLGEKRELHGRDSQMELLYNHITSEGSEAIKLINVCGIPGIGKSYLVKHLASRLYNEGDHDVTYLDLRGVARVTDIPMRALDKLSVSASSPSELFGALIQYFEINSADKHVLIFDDLSGLMDDEDEENKMLAFIHKFYLHAKKSNLKITIVTTSSRKFQMVDECSKPSPTDVANYAEDLWLDPLNAEDSEAILGHCKYEISEQDKDKLLEVSVGHPYSLLLLSTLADTNIELTKQIIGEFPNDAVRCNSASMNKLFSVAFQNLAEQQKKVLLTIAFFNGHARLGVVCQIVDAQRANVDDFCDQIKLEFNNGFWLMFRTSDVRVECVRKTLVRPFHPSVSKFLRSMIVSYERGSMTDQKTIGEIKEAYISRHVQTLIGVGRNCVVNPLESSDLLVRELANIKRALTLMTESGNAVLLFNSKQHTMERRTDGDIAYLFLCLHEYYHLFDGLILKILAKAMGSVNDIKDLRSQALLGTLYMLMLTVEEDWSTLECAMASRNTTATPKQSSIFYFCEALNHYIQGKLQTYTKTEQDTGALRKLFDKAIQCLKRFHKGQGSTPDCDIARRYFKVHVLLTTSTHLYSSDAGNFQEALESCGDARKDASVVSILKPLVFTKMAELHAYEGKLDTAIKLYETVDKIYKDCNQENLDASARCLLSLSFLLRKMSLSKNRASSDALEKLEEAKQMCEDAVKILERNSLLSHCKEDLLRSYEQLAMCSYTLAECDRVRDPCKREQLRKMASKYYRMSYNLIHRYPQHCNLSADLPLIERMLNQLPQLITCSETKQKISDNLTKAHDEALGKSIRSRRFSGSSIASSCDMSEVISRPTEYSKPVQVTDSAEEDGPSAPKKVRTE